MAWHWHWLWPGHWNWPGHSRISPGIALAVVVAVAVALWPLGYAALHYLFTLGSLKWDTLRFPSALMTKWAVRPESSFKASFNAFATCLFAVSHAQTQAHTLMHLSLVQTHTCIFRDTQNEIQRYIWTSYHFSCLGLMGGTHDEPTLRSTGRTTLQTENLLILSVQFQNGPLPGAGLSSTTMPKCVPAGRPRFIFFAVFFLARFHLRKMCIEIWDICLGYYYKRPGLRSGGITRPNHHLTVKRIFSQLLSSSSGPFVSGLCRVGVS